MTDARPDAPVMPALHARIMNLPCKPPVDELLNPISLAWAYALGHRDARHAAADLALREGSEPKAETAGLGAEPVEPGPKDAPEEGYSDKSYIADLEYEVKRLGNMLAQRAAPAEGVQPVAPRCSYPDCKCPVDAPPNWCARGLPVAAPQAEAAGVPNPEIERLQGEIDAITELNHARWLALENVRLLAARHRREEWAKSMLRFCMEADVASRTLRAAARDSQAPAAPAAPVDALRYATMLAVALHAKHYAAVTQWKPLPDLLGVLTQIDNMVAALSRPQAEQEPT